MVCSYFHTRRHKIKLRPDIYEVSRRLVQRGHRVVVLAAKAFGAPSYEIVDGVEVYRVPALSMPGIFYFIPSFPHLIGRLLKICEQHDIQIIHFWNYEYLNSALAFLVRKKLANLPFVLTVIGFPGINWRYGVKMVDAIGLMYTYTIGKLVFSSVDRVVLLGQSLTKYAKSMNVSEQKILVCPLGVQVEAFRPTKSSNDIHKEIGISPSEVVVTYVGRLEQVKGVTYLLQAAKILRDRFKNLRFLIVGDGPLRPKLERISTSQTLFLGWRKDVANLLSISDIVVFPSLSEGLPIAMLEAFALGKPVVATNVGAVPDLVVNKRTGLLIASRNSLAIEEAITYLLGNPEIAYAMGANGKEFVKKHHNWDFIIDKYEALYNSVRDVNMIHRK